MKNTLLGGSRMPIVAAALGLALVGAVGLGMTTQSLFADSGSQTVSDDTGTESKPKPSGGCTCEE